MQKQKLIRTATVAMSLDILLKGQLQFLNDFYEVVAISGEDSHLENVRNREKVTTISVDMQRQISPVKDFISLVKLYQVFKKEKPQIVHSITPKAGLLSMIAAYFAGVPVRIHTFTGLIFPYKSGILKWILIVMDKILCRYATHIIPEGNGVKNDLIAYNITKKPLQIIANGNVNGIDIDYFKVDNFTELENRNLKESLKISNNDFVYIFVGRLVKDKGINELIAAFVKLNLENQNAKLLLVGPFEQDLDPILPQIIHEIENHENIISVGYQQDVRPYFAIANCLVFPSYREGFPNVVLQAGAMNLPSIVSNINGCNEIIINDINGLIIPSKNENDLFKAMRLLSNDENLHQNLKENARNLIVERFEQKLVWENILNKYQNCLLK